MRTIISLIILALAFCLTEVTLTFYLPEAATKFDVWLKYFTVKDATYDAMFFLFSLVVFWNNTKPLPKSICVFLVIVTGGSFIDKVIFDMNQYLSSDVVLISLGIYLSVTKYRKWKTKTLKAG